jgi:hypothetical protein
MMRSSLQPLKECFRMMGQMHHGHTRREMQCQGMVHRHQGISAPQQGLEAPQQGMSAPQQGLEATARCHTLAASLHVSQAVWQSCLHGKNSPHGQL